MGKACKTCKMSRVKWFENYKYELRSKTYCMDHPVEGLKQVPRDWKCKKWEGKNEQFRQSKTT